MTYVIERDCTQSSLTSSSISDGSTFSCWWYCLVYCMNLLPTETVNCWMNVQVDIRVLLLNARFISFLFMQLNEYNVIVVHHTCAAFYLFVLVDPQPF